MQIRLYKRNKHNETNEKKHFILKMDTWGIPPSLQTQQPKRISLWQMHSIRKDNTW